ncbi:hypothetical protein [Scytonema sp. PCC 10023]|uniref:hypothetical protein n=1 Tax=Scytonema sp. PCC 10023 TaxID=1680591 RepID=UPI0039C718E7
MKTKVYRTFTAFKLSQLKKLITARYLEDCLNFLQGITQIKKNSVVRMQNSAWASHK